MSCCLILLPGLLSNSERNLCPDKMIPSVLLVFFGWLLLLLCFSVCVFNLLECPFGLGALCPPFPGGVTEERSKWLADQWSGSVWQSWGAHRSKISGFYFASSITASSKMGCLCTAHRVLTGAESLSKAAAVERVWEIILFSPQRWENIHY